MKLLTPFTAYCTAVMLAFLLAAWQGYAVSSLFSNQEKADKTATHYHK